MDIVLAKQNNEREVKSYLCTAWNFPKAEGHLTVTTERIIFHGATNPAANGTPANRIVQEAELKSISGLSSFYGVKVNWLWILIGAALALGALMGSISLAKLAGSSYMPTDFKVMAGFGCLLLIAMIVGSILIVVLMGFGKAFFLNIYSSQSAGTPISLGNADRANHVLLSLCGQPTATTDYMMKELGALITDLKTDKEEAFRMWGPKVEPERN